MAGIDQELKISGLLKCASQLAVVFGVAFTVSLISVKAEAIDTNRRTAKAQRIVPNSSGAAPVCADLATAHSTADQMLNSEDSAPTDYEGQLNLLYGEQQRVLVFEDNPFAEAVNPQQAWEMYKVLATRNEHTRPMVPVMFANFLDADFDASTPPIAFTPCEQMRRVLSATVLTAEPRFNQNLLKLVLQDSKNLISEVDRDGFSPWHRQQLQGAITAVRQAQVYLKRVPPPKPPEQDQSNKESQNQKQDPKQNKDQNPKQKQNQQQPNQSQNQDPKPNQGSGQAPGPNSGNQSGQSAGSGQSQSVLPPDRLPEIPQQYIPGDESAQEPKKPDEAEASQAKLEEISLYEFNADTKYFRVRRFHTLKRGPPSVVTETPLPVDLPSIGLFRPTTQKLKVLITAEEMDLAVPVGFEPLASFDPRIQVVRLASDGYQLKVAAGLLGQSIELGLQPARDIRVDGFAQLGLIEPFRIRKEEWPETIQHQLFPAVDAIPLNTKSQLATAKVVAEFIKSHFQYSRECESGKNDPVQLASGKVLKCDTASLLMLAILRDVYRIPSSFVGGYRSTVKQVADKKSSILTADSEPHAWVEVYHAGQWHVFDPTPLTKPEQQSGKAQQGEAGADNQTEPDHDTNQPNKANSGHETDEQQGADPKAGKAGETKAKDGNRENSDASKDKASKSSVGQTAEKNSPELPSEAGGLNPGEASLVDQFTRNSLLRKMMSRLLYELADPFVYNREEVAQRLVRIESTVRAANDSSITGLFSHSKNAFQTQGHGVIESAKRMLLLVGSEDEAGNKSDVNDLFSELIGLEKMISSSLALLTLENSGRSTLSPALAQSKLQEQRAAQNALSQLRKIKALLQQSAHAKSGEVALVKEVMSGLDMIALSALQEKFGFSKSDIGFNAATSAFAENILNGEATEFVRMSRLSQHTNFILDSVPSPAFLDVRTFERDRRYARGQDWIAITNPAEAHRGIRLQPMKSVFENMREGTLVMPARMQTTPIETGRGRPDRKRVSIVLADRSPSTKGPIKEFLESLIGKFVDRSLSDVTPKGRHRHVMLVNSFASDILKRTKVSNAREAKDVLFDIDEALGGIEPGTDGELALLDALESIYKAQTEAGEPLEIANIILFSDGEFKLDSQKIQEARAKIHRSTPVQIMTVSLGDSANETLKSIALESRSMGFDMGFYRQFDKTMINEFINSTKVVQVPNNDDVFYSEMKLSTIRAVVDPEIQKLIDLLKQWSDARESSANDITNIRLQQFQLQIQSITNDRLPRPLLGQLQKLRQVVNAHKLELGNAAIFNGQRTSQNVQKDLLLHFEELTGIPLGSLTSDEKATLQNLLLEL